MLSSSLSVQSVSVATKSTTSTQLPVDDQLQQRRRRKKARRGPKPIRADQCHFVVPPPKNRRCNLTAAPGSKFCGIHARLEEEEEAGSSCEDAGGSAPTSTAGPRVGSTSCPYCGHVVRQYTKLAKHVRRCAEVARLQPQSKSAGGAGIGSAERTTVDGVVGALSIVSDGFLDATDDHVPENVLQLCRDRAEAKSRRDFATADRLRELVWAAGFVVQDIVTPPDKTTADAVRSVRVGGFVLVIFVVRLHVCLEGCHLVNHLCYCCCCCCCCCCVVRFV